MTNIMKEVTRIMILYLHQIGIFRAQLLIISLYHVKAMHARADVSIFVLQISPLTRQDLVTWKVALERKPAVLDGTSFSDGIEVS